MNDNDKNLLMILGGSDYARIQLLEMPRVWLPGEPVAELTRFGWVILSPGN